LNLIKQSHTSAYGGVIPVEDAGSSAAKMPHPVTSSMPSSSKVVLDFYPTDVALSQTQNFAVPGNQKAFPSRAVPPPEEIIDLTVDPPDAHVNIPLIMQTRFFRSGVLKIKSASSKTPTAMDVTSAAETGVLLDSDFDGDVPLREHIIGEDYSTANPREERTRASSQILPNDPSELSLPIPALILGLTPGASRVPLDTHDKPRRILGADWNSSLITVSMRGFVESLDISSLVFQRNLRRPAAPAQESVDDACVLHAGDTSIVILAHAREEKQISYLSFQSCRVSIRGDPSPSFKHVQIHRELGFALLIVRGIRPRGGERVLCQR